MVEIGRASHSLRGECGLKSKFVRNVFGNSASLSARRVWIEIISAAEEIKKYKSLSARRVWIEIRSAADEIKKYKSLSARRVWIEIGTVTG